MGSPCVLHNTKSILRDSVSVTCTCKSSLYVEIHIGHSWYMLHLKSFVILEYTVHIHVCIW